jgi:hypothetical protein
MAGHVALKTKTALVLAVVGAEFFFPSFADK